MNYVNVQTGEILTNVTYAECVTYGREDVARGFNVNPYTWVTEDKFNQMCANHEIKFPL